MSYSKICNYRHVSFSHARSRLVLPAMLGLLFVFTFNATATADEIDVWVGTGGRGGIFHLTLDTEKGQMSKPEHAAEIEGAGFLAMHRHGTVLYATSKDNGGSVAAFEIGGRADFDRQELRLKAEKRSLLQKLGRGHPSVKEIDAKIAAYESMRKATPKPRGDDPSSEPSLHLSNVLATGDGGAACVGADKTGQVLMSAQYGGGSISTYTINPDGSLGQRVEVIEHGEGSGFDPKRQAKSHPHWVGTSPDNRFLMVPDLGLDRVVVYELDSETAKLKPHSKIAVPPGSGPRHMKFHPSGKYAYVLNELALTISVFEYDVASGDFKDIQLIESLPEDLKDKYLNSAAEIRVHPSGRFVYSSNRGHDSISVFSVDQATGKLVFVEHEAIRGSWPRNFNIDPSGKWLIAAGQYSNSLSLFEIDQESGELIFTRKVVNVPAPICVLFGAK